MVYARIAVAATALALSAVLPASPASAAVPTASQVSAADQQTILALHNQYRAAAGVARLVWDDQLAADAQTWVDALVQRGGSLAHDNPANPNDPDTASAKGQGENLAGGQSAATAPGQWYEEKPQFDAAPNKSGFSDANPDWVNWGHYTQMMWSATTRIGCGTAPGPRFQITSCRYSPPGNFDGQLPYPGADALAVNAVTGEPAAPSSGTEPTAVGNNPPQSGDGNVAPADSGTPEIDGSAGDSGPPAGDTAPAGEGAAPDTGTPADSGG